jgi:hypothetical protein
MNWSIVIAVGFLNSASGLSQTAGGRSNLTNTVSKKLRIGKETNKILNMGVDKFNFFDK